MFFYSWGALDLTGILLVSIIFTYIFGILVRKSKYRRTSLAVGIIFLIGMLGVYKYYDFAMSFIPDRYFSSYRTLDLPIPPGISFFIFSSVSYLIDIYRQKGKLKPGLIDTALYISFFPKLIMGPITLFSNFYDQISNRVITLEKVRNGLVRFCYGFALKVIIADPLGAVVNEIFTQVEFGITTSTAWTGVLLYSLQIYFDFLGYSVMAIGIALCFGFELGKNFNYPYISTSITEFWRRWHISLSTWFRDYLYIPLGGNRRGNVYVNVMIVFLATGIWHGASWTFIVWGIIHGICNIFEKYMSDKPIYQKTPVILKWLVTTFIIGIGWLLFRSPTFSFFIDYMAIMFGQKDSISTEMSTSFFITSKIMFTTLIAIVLSFPVIPLIKERFGSIYKNADVLSTAVQNIFALAMLIIGVLYMVNSTYSPFIYFQF
ncbi:MBOAT family O-acyltransferase [Neobacillus niacini]|uniref:MBOAT family O-acyltransferase n=1 Tax=Neobacillus niacini TaxID=86668 RepID=UPI0030008AD1